MNCPCIYCGEETDDCCPYPWICCKCEERALEEYFELLHNNEDNING